MKIHNENEELIDTIVSRIISRLNAPENSGDFVKVTDRSGILKVVTDTVRTEPFEARGVYLKDVTTLEEAPRIGAGLMELKDGASLEWTLTYDEFDVVLEGILEIEIDGRVVSAKQHELIYIPKGSHIHFQTPNYAKYYYFVYPANWASL